MKKKALHMTFVVPLAELAFSCFLVFLFSVPVASAQTVGTWDSRAVLPAPKNQGNGNAYLSSTNRVYVLRGDDMAFYAYNPDANTWATLTSTTCLSGGASALVAAGSVLYAAIGSCNSGGSFTDFIRYTPGTDTWADMAVSPFGLGTGVALAWDGDDYIYALAGNASSFFYRYSISGDSWSDAAVADTPAGTNGGGLAGPVSGVLYAFRGLGTKTAYKYTIGTDTWDTIADAPDVVGAGAGTMTLGGSTIYAAPGDTGVSSTDFWSYNPGSDTWTTLTAALPAGGGTGTTLTYASNSSGAFVFETRGATTDNFNYYTISLPVSTGGSAGSFLLAERQDAGLSLARATPPAAPVNVVVAPTPCNGSCGATITFSSSPLPIHAGRPMTYAFIDESNNVLGSIYEPFASAKSYVLELKNLPLNSPLNGRLCAQFSPREGCVNVQSWTLFTLDPKTVKVTSVVEGDGYRVRVGVPKFTNEGVEQSGVRVNVERAGAAALQSARTGRMPAAETFLAQITGIFSPAQSGASHDAGAAPAEVVSILPLTRAVPKTASGGVLASPKTVPLPATEKLPATFLTRSGEWQVVLAPGEYKIVLTPVNGRGVSGPALTLPLSLSPPGDPLALSASVEIAGGQLRTSLDAAPNLQGNTGVDLLTTRAGVAFALRAGAEPAEVHLALTALVVPAVLANGKNSAAADERFEFIFLCASGAKNCAAKSASSQKGNVVSRSVLAKNSDGFVTVKTDDAIVTVRVTESATQVGVTAAGELKRLTSEESVALAAFRGGEALLSVSATDALGNTASIRDVAMHIPGSGAAITAFTAASAGDEGDIEARGTVDYANFAERGLLMNLSFAEEGLPGARVLPGIPRLVQVLVARDDGAGVQFAIACEETCGVAAITAPQGKPLTVAQKENSDGTVSARAGGVTLTYDAQNAMPVLLVADASGFSGVEIRARYASLGLGNFAGEFSANEASARAAFFGAGQYLNLFPEVVGKIMMDLSPFIINYIAPQTPAPVVENVGGGKVISEPQSVQLLNVGAPVSPLLNAALKFFGIGQ